MDYPETKKMDQIDEYFRTRVEDPYRWLEDLNSDETREWIAKQNSLTENFLESIPFRDDLKKHLTELWDYEKYSSPRKVGEYYLFFKNDGLQEQSVVYIQKGLDAEPEMFIDPNTFSEDGSISLAGIFPSKDHKYCGYGIQKGGSDWVEFFVRDIVTGEDLDDHIHWAKFTGMAWYKDGFYYSRYPEPEEDEKLKAKNEYHTVYYHRLGDSQSEDSLIYRDNEHPQRSFHAGVTEDEKYMILYGSEGAAGENCLFYKDLERDSDIRAVVDNFDARYGVVDTHEDNLIVITDKDAPKFRLVLIDPAHPDKDNWQTVLPESEHVLENVSYLDGKIIANYLQDASSRVKVYTIAGAHQYDIDLPGIGSISGFGGEKEDRETFFTFTSFDTPSTIYRYDVRENRYTVFRESNARVNPDDYIVKQQFFESKDGTRIPMFIVHKRGLELDGSNPTLLYGYGGFNISLTPSFAISRMPLLQSGCVFAMANLRGGGEYGEEWHRAGMLENKQNVFDDFTAAAEYLIDEQYTSPEKLAIHGGSNGGLLVGAVVNQRPDLFKVAMPAVGVMDMLRYHTFTIGWAWKSEYGSSEDEDHFDNLYSYSPLHNIEEGVQYPAVLVTTADHDDRVFPGHSFKYIAALQEKQRGNNPALIRIETKVGHGAGTATSKTISLYTDLWSFMLYNLGENPDFSSA